MLEQLVHRISTSTDALTGMFNHFGEGSAQIAFVIESLYLLSSSSASDLSDGLSLYSAIDPGTGAGGHLGPTLGLLFTQFGVDEWTQISRRS